MYFEIGVCWQGLLGRGARRSPAVADEEFNLSAGIFSASRVEKTLKLLKSRRICREGCYNR